MSSPEGRWWSTRAGEYVLGTLRGQDLELFERILDHDTDMQGEVARWERWLAPLHETTRSRTPAADVWPRIVARIRASGSRESGSTARDRRPAANDRLRPGDTESREGASDIAALRSVPVTREDEGRALAARPSRWWPAIATLATAASLVLSVLVGVLLQRERPSGPSLDVDGLAVVLSDEDGEPYFLVETDYGNLRVRVTALTPPALEDERNFQLWQALPDGSAVRPVALLPAQSGRTRVFDVESLIDGSELFGVSIEPVGAPTDDGPTGPVVAHGDFLPKADAN